MKGKDYYLKNQCANLLLLSGQELTILLDKNRITVDDIVTSLGERFEDDFLLLLSKLEKDKFPQMYQAARQISVYSLIQTEVGRQILLADGARVLRAMSIEQMTPRFITSLLQYLDESETLQAYLREDDCPLLEKLIEPYYDTFVINVLGPYDIRDSDDIPPLASPLLQLAKSSVGRQLLLAQRDSLIKHISAKALTTGDHKEETPLFYLIDDSEILDCLLEDEAHFGEWVTLSVSAKINVTDASAISLIDKIIAHPKALQILFSNHFSGLRALSKEEKICLQRQVSIETYQKRLALHITSAASFGVVSDFLEDDKCLDWLKMPMFQAAIKALIESDLAGLATLPKTHSMLFFNSLSLEALEQLLIDVMSTKQSYQNVMGYLFSINRLDWIKHDGFQRAIASLFITLMNSNSLPTEEADFRLFIQMMGRTALSLVTDKGQSVLSCLCRFEDGVRLIQKERLYESVTQKTLDISIQGTNTNLRGLLHETCHISLQLDSDVATPRFFQS